jgi:hypothetical protein
MEREPEAELYELPENLERFFGGRVATQTAEPQPVGCCPPAEQHGCCEPEAKAVCCGAASGEGCGWR